MSEEPDPYFDRVVKHKMPDLPTRRCILDNRVFLLGLDGLYREAVKPHERGELLICARKVADVLCVQAADVPVEGYYSEHPQLTEYFKLMRALQATPNGRTSEVAALPEFQRLLTVSSAPLYGQPQQTEGLLPMGCDPLSEALRESGPQWTVARLTAMAYAKAQEMDDFSLVGLAARIQDPVVLAAIRESVVLYALDVILGLDIKARPEYVWAVDDELAAQARRFVMAFEDLFGDKIPAPEPAQAQRYWQAYEDNEIVGRCVRLGYDQGEPRRHYHWAIRPRFGELTVHEFWDTEVWTTARYRERLTRSLDSVRVALDAVRIESRSKIAKWIENWRRW